MGPYPQFGMYVPLQLFRTPGAPVMVDTEMLNMEVLALWMKVALQHKYDSLRERMQLLKDDSVATETARTKELVDRIEDGAPAYADAVSFAGQQNCNSTMKQRIEKIEEMMPHLRDMRRRFPRGIATQPAA
jgi:hypothetical protein